MRAFVAIPLPAAASAAASTLLPAHAALRQVAPERMHLTLAFLGDVAPDVVPCAAAALEEAARRHRSFCLSFDQLGRFPASGPPRVVWLGVGEGRAAVVALAGDIRAALARRAIGHDAKPLEAHVTLARLSERALPEDIRAIGALLRAARVAPVEARVDEVVLYESVLGRGGPRYTRRASAGLDVAGRVR